jgi:trans-aconitate methyltransferase
MLPKPKHLGPEYSAQFQDRSVVTAYPNRPPYPAEVFALLASLITDAPRAVLDVGCGDGAIARHLVERVDRLDALDFSEAMIAQGRWLPNGDHPKLYWIAGRAEDALLRSPYALITAGASLHWMDWYKTAYHWWQAGQLDAYQLPTGTIIVREAHPAPSGVALYARVSSADQKEDATRQMERLREYASARG